MKECLPFEWAPPPGTGFEPAKIRGSLAIFSRSPFQTRPSRHCDKFLWGIVHYCYRSRGSLAVFSLLGYDHQGSPHTLNAVFTFYMLTVGCRKYCQIPNTDRPHEPVYRALIINQGTSSMPRGDGRGQRRSPGGGRAKWGGHKP